MLPILTEVHETTLNFNMIELVMILLAAFLFYIGHKTKGFVWFLLSGFSILYLAIVYSHSVFLLVLFIGVSLTITTYGLFGGKS